jgi:hypothetical protein
MSRLQLNFESMECTSRASPAFERKCLYGQIFGDAIRPGTPIDMSGPPDTGQSAGQSGAPASGSGASACWLIAPIGGRLAQPAARPPQAARQGRPAPAAGCA